MGVAVNGVVRSLKDFYRGKRVVITGHTGLKGSWLGLWLADMGADVLGIALPPNSELSAYSSCNLGGLLRSEFLDIRDRDGTMKLLRAFAPDVVLHLAAQAIVGQSYADPVNTFSTNVLGSINVLDCVRSLPTVKSAVMITSDKCYENVEQIWGYRETDRLGGSDPYSASKACAELAIRSFIDSYFSKAGTANVATARAGNVIGGGDWSQYRLVPDCIRSLRANQPISIRNPMATRPWQFVMDPLAGYLMLAQRLATPGKDFSGAWNFGPPVDNNNNVERGANELTAAWGGGSLEIVPNPLFHESRFLQLDCTKSRVALGWQPAVDFSQTMNLTAQWYRKQFDTKDGSMIDFTLSQIKEFELLMDARL